MCIVTIGYEVLSGASLLGWGRCVGVAGRRDYLFRGSLPGSCAAAWLLRWATDIREWVKIERLRRDLSVAS